MENIEKTLKYHFGSPLPEETLNEIVQKFEKTMEPIKINDSN